MTSYTASVGESINIVFNIDAPGGFNNLRFDITHDATSQSILDPGPITESRGAGDVVLTRTFTYTSPALPIDFGGESFTITFEVVDDNNLSSTTTLSLDVDEEPIDIFSTFMLAAPLGDLSAENFFSTNEGLKYSSETVLASQENVSQNIDFGYYYGNTDEASIASPAGFENTAFASQVANWTTKNSTTLLTTSMTQSQFIEIDTFSEIETAFTNGSDGAQIKTRLAVGDVLAFETNSTKANSPSKKGLILVTAINGTFNENDNIEIQVVVQQ